MQINNDCEGDFIFFFYLSIVACQSFPLMYVMNNYHQLSSVPVITLE